MSRKHVPIAATIHILTQTLTLASERRYVFLLTQESLRIQSRLIHGPPYLGKAGLIANIPQEASAPYAPL